MKLSDPFYLLDSLLGGRVVGLQPEGFAVRVDRLVDPALAYEYFT